MNKLVIITGGTKGIGKALVLKFLAEGFEIITCSRNLKQLTELQKEINTGQNSTLVHIFQADLSKKEEIKAFASYIHSFNKPIELLINNTGIYLPGQIHSEEEGVLEKLIDTNLYSAYHLTRALLPKMIELKHGFIMSICSTASIVPYVNGGSYCISKYALLGMTKVLREELKPFNIKVTAILPGATKTASWDGVELPEDRFIKPIDIAETIFAVYKLSPNAVVEEVLIRPQLGDIQ